jgi:hypothetical protein
MGSRRSFRFAEGAFCEWRLALRRATVLSGNIGVCFQINDGGKSGYCPTIHPQLAGEASSQRLYHNYREIILLVMNRYRIQ